MHRIVVLGAGYAGMLAAIRVARRTGRHGGQVTLVNPAEWFVERLRMHQIGAGQHLTDLRIPELLQGTGVSFVVGRAERIDAARREVHTQERTIGYDTLIYAIGSVADTAAVPGAEEHAYTLNDRKSAGALAERLAARPDATVAVVGGGLTGVEAAAEIAAPGRRVLLLSLDEPGSMMSAPARAYLHRALARLGVSVRAGVEVVKVLPGGVELGRSVRAGVDFGDALPGGAELGRSARTDAESADALPGGVEPGLNVRARLDFGDVLPSGVELGRSVRAGVELADALPGGSALGLNVRARLDFGDVLSGGVELGRSVRAGVEVVNVVPGGAHPGGGEVIDVDACLWTTGFRAASLAAEAGMAVDGTGRVVVDAQLRSVPHPEVYAVGDATAIQQEWGTVHGTCQSGLPSAAHAADNMGRLVRGKGQVAFRFGHLHQPVSLGRRDAVIQFTHRDDTPPAGYGCGAGSRCST